MTVKKKTSTKKVDKATSAISKKTIKSDNYLVDPKKLLDAGAHFGHHVSRWNPQMDQYIYSTKNNVHIIDLIQTSHLLKNAADFVYQLTKDGGTILFVGTKKQSSSIIEKIARQVSMPYMNRRWLGGTLTNFSTIAKRINKLKKLELDESEGNLQTKTKKELLKKRVEIEKLNLNLCGIKNMDKLPQAVLAADMPREMIAIKEANKLSIPVIAIADTNSQVELADYPIPANDDAIKSINIILETIVKAIEQGKKEYQAKIKDTSEEKINE